MHLCLYVCIDVCIYVYMHLCLYCMRIYIYIYIYVGVCMCRYHCHCYQSQHTPKPIDVQSESPRQTTSGALMKTRRPPNRMCNNELSKMVLSYALFIRSIIGHNADVSDDGERARSRPRHLTHHSRCSRASSHRTPRHPLCVDISLSMYDETDDDDGDDPATHTWTPGPSSIQLQCQWT
jgi:hypothetical protein